MRTVRKVLILLPTWVGDAAMATPFLRALRDAMPDATLTGVGTRAAKATLNGSDLLDRIRSYRPGTSTLTLAKRLRADAFDLGILLPNSFRTAALLRLAGVPRRIGFARDGRGWLLTERATLPTSGDGPVPQVDYYNALLPTLGLKPTTRQMALSVTDREQRRARDLLMATGLENDLHRPADAGRPPLVLLNPGGSYGAAKLWPTGHFAALADRLTEEWNAIVGLTTAPAERPIAAEIVARARCRIHDLAATGLLNLGAVKDLCRRADLVVTNDTGTRHLAAAFGTRLITIFGPTDPRRTTLNYGREIELMEPVECGPCQLKACPLPEPQTKQCMTLVTPDRVFNAASQLITGSPLPVAS